MFGYKVHVLVRRGTCKDVVCLWRCYLFEQSLGLLLFLGHWTRMWRRGSAIRASCYAMLNVWMLWDKMLRNTIEI
jgi:hypothetical protein